MTPTQITEPRGRDIAEDEPAFGPVTLVSHPLCPYVQRAAIVLAEKGVAFDRVYVDLGNKPAWFTRLSPLGRVPLLRVEGDGEPAVLFESAVIVEYLEDTEAPALHPGDPLERARHRAWVEFGSSILQAIAAFYGAAPADIEDRTARLESMFARVEAELVDGPWFGGESFSVVDATYAPVFRYFDVFDAVADFRVLTGKPRVAAWRANLASRPSVIFAVAPDYPQALRAFLLRRQSALSDRMAA